MITLSTCTLVLYQKKKQPRLEDSRVREAEQELERERNALQQRQEDEQLALKVQNPGAESNSGGSFTETSVNSNSQ